MSLKGDQLEFLLGVHGKKVFIYVFYLNRWTTKIPCPGAKRVNILCKINLAFFSYGSIHPQRIFDFIFWYNHTSTYNLIKISM